jgi:hypothetical protein
VLCLVEHWSGRVPCQKWLSWRRGRMPILEKSQAKLGQLRAIMRTQLSTTQCGDASGVRNHSRITRASSLGPNDAAFTRTALHSPPISAIFSSQHVSQPAPRFPQPGCETCSTSKILSLNNDQTNFPLSQPKQDLGAPYLSTWFSLCGSEWDPSVILQILILLKADRDYSLSALEFCFR